MKTILSTFLVIIFVAVGCAVASQPVPLNQEFDDEAKPGTGDVTDRSVPPKSGVIQKQITSSIKDNQDKSSTSSAAQETSTRTGDMSLRQFFGSLLPSKQDLDKAFDDEFNRSFAPRPNNWRNGEK
jgi:hypothetical protein